MKNILTLFLALLSCGLLAQADRSVVKSYPAMSSSGVYLGQIPALRTLTPKTNYTTKKRGKLFEKRNYFFGNKANNPNPQPQNGDPLVKKASVDDRTGGPEIIPGFNFEGLHDPSGVYPPDPTGDIGKDHYVQMVNTSEGAWFQVWDKLTGNSVYGPALTSTIWGQIGATSFGDPIIQYDHAAERWLMLELSGLGSNELVIAISDDSDPTGSWKAYRMQTLGFPDYPKLYLWHNAYFITVNEILTTNVCSGYALNRADLLSGADNFDVYRFEMPNFQGIDFQPATGADWVGGPPPPPGSPGYIFRLYDDAWNGGQDHLETWEVHLDWANSTLSHIDGPALLYPEPFETRVCYGPTFTFDCIEQPDGGPLITALENTILYRAPYRNFGDHESVVLNHISDVSGIVGDGGDAEVRWYELRKSGAGDWQLYQQGTYAPDVQTNRFMSTICMDEAGNIGLGYTGVSEQLYPGLYLTGHRQGDPLGEMTVEEYTLAAGGASHQSSRWGDYSSMTVDPYDGRIFWFTGEYQPNDVDTWGTRIGSFTLRRDTFDIQPTALVTPVSSSFLGNAETVKLRISNGGLTDATGVSVSMYLENNLVATENIPGTIVAGTAVDHTFGQTVALPQPGTAYHFRFITHWNKDVFAKNDTLNTTVTKFTAYDAALVGQYNLQGMVCGTEADFALILKNAAGVPMTSATLQWRINAGTWQVYNWTGNLAPGARDTIPLHATGIVDGNNTLEAVTSLPNGAPDEATGNDQFSIGFLGNTDGTYLEAAVTSNFGILHWELRSQGFQLLSEGELSGNQSTALICSDDNTCYNLVLSSPTFDWTGHFVLTDIFGNILVDAFEANPSGTVYSFCTPVRQQQDVGAWALIAPVSGPNLSANEPVTMQYRNFGLTAQSNVNVSYRLNNGALHTETVPGPIAPGEKVVHTFSTTENLNTIGIQYNFQLKATVPGDQSPYNDTISAVVEKRHLRELELVGITSGTACGDTSFAFVNMTIRNNGIGNIHTFDLESKLNGVQQPLIQFNTTYAEPDQTETITVYVANLKPGANTLELNITNVDDSGEDEVSTNDAGSITFDISPENVTLDLFLIADENPQETTWDLVDGQGNIVFSGGPYTEPFGLAIENLCVKRDSCYEFRLHDAGGDGLFGYFSLSVDNLVIFEFSGQPFTSEFVYPFCAVTLCSDMVLTGNATPPSSPTGNDGQIEAQVTGGAPPYFFLLDGGDIQESPVFNNLSAGLHTLVCIDAQGCIKSITIDLEYVGTEEPKAFARLKVSPNPTSGIAHLELPLTGTAKTAQGEVYDVHGKLVQTARLTRWDDALHGNIALDKFAAGIYLVKVTGLDRVYAARVIKK